MNDEMTPRERDDMRDLIMASTQRPYPAQSSRRVVSVATAVAGVAVIVGGIFVTGQLAGTPTSPGPIGAPTSTATPPPERCEPPDFPRASLPDLPVPASGTHVRLELDPCLTAKSLLGTQSWLNAQGVDVASVQGFQSIGGIEMWAAKLSEGSGQCLIIRSANRNGFDELVCDASGSPASVVRMVGDATLTFTLEESGVMVAVTGE